MALQRLAFSFFLAMNPLVTGLSSVRRRRWVLGSRLPRCRVQRERSSADNDDKPSGAEAGHGRTTSWHSTTKTMIEMAMAEIAAGREGPFMPSSPAFSPPLKSAERNPQKGAADDVGAED